MLAQAAMGMMGTRVMKVVTMVTRTGGGDEDRDDSDETRKVSLSFSSFMLQII